MTSAFFWGFVAASSLVVGGLLGSFMTIGRRTLGVIMAFGAGVLIAAVTFELVFKALYLAKFTGFPVLGFFAGAATFFVSDLLVGAMGGAVTARASRRPISRVWSCRWFSQPSWTEFPRPWSSA